MPSPTIENYLKAMYFLADDQGSLSVKDLSKRMEVTMPTTNSMVKKLKAKGWVIYKKYKPLKLTQEGHKMAALILRKHRLTEMYLTEKMGFGWEEVHDIAEQLEHIDSPAFFDRMDEILGFPVEDPHGSPIPDADGHIKIKDYHSLDTIDVKSKVRIRSLKDSSDAFLRYLNKINIGLGTEIIILDKEEFDGSIEVQYQGQTTSRFSQEVSERLLVELIH